jgi:hypothetical protein
MLLYILLLFCISNVASSQFNPYKQFAVESDGVFVQEGLGIVISAYQAPDNTIITLYSLGTIIKLNPSGQEISRIDLEQEITYAHFEDDRFVVTLWNRRGNPTDTNNITRIKYDLSFDDSFGENGISAIFKDNTLDVRFGMITKKNNFYYVGGDRSDGRNRSSLLVRYTDKGSLDFTFSETGYIVLGNVNHSRIYHALFFKDSLVLRTHKSFVKLSTGDFSVLSSKDGLSSSNIEQYDDTSFFVCNNNTIYKYTDSLDLDTSFNKGTGSITFDLIATLFPNESNTYRLTYIKKVGNHLIASGYTSVADGSDNYNYIPYIVCYNISDLNNPYLESTFLDKGYFSGSTSVYTFYFTSKTSVFITTNTIPYLFLASDRYLTCFPLSTQFSNLMFPKKTFSEYIMSKAAAGKIVPFAI